MVQEVSLNGSSILFTNGALLLFLGLLMILPFLVECVTGGVLPWTEFLLPMMSCAFLGGLLVVLNRRPEPPQIGTKEAFILTTATWILLPLFAGLPFYFSLHLKASFVDAWFEGVSALTATGSSVFPPDALPRSLLVWRFLLSFIGGVGMILMGMIIFPILRIGGMQLFRTESSEKTEKILPSVTQIASWILGVYTGAIFLCCVLLRFVGVPFTDALCHSISAISTCGFSTHPESVVALHNPAAEIVLICAMVFGGSSLLLFIKIIKGRGIRTALLDAQWTGYIKTLLIFGLTASILRSLLSPLGILEGLREGIFMTVSMITTTAFLNSNYETWGTFATVLFPVLSLVGGCTGSTSGGIKIFRLQVLLACLKTHLRQLRTPHGVFTATYNGQKISESVQISVLVFILLYLTAIGMSAMGLSLCGLDFTTSLTAAIASIGNVGIGIGPLVGPAGALAGLAALPKLILMAGMVLGRLELLTILTLLSPTFWKK